MTTVGSTIAHGNQGGAAPLRCPLCGGEWSLALGGVGKPVSCPKCGFNVGQLPETPNKQSASAGDEPATAALSPLDRWLKGEPMQPDRLGAWQRATIWSRQHPRLAGTAGVAVVAVVVLVIGSWFAYAHTADALASARIERDALAADRASLREVATDKTEQLSFQEARWQNELRERQSLQENLRRLQTNYAESKQLNQTAERRIHNAVRAARFAVAEDLSRQAEELHYNMPDASLLLAAKALSITQADGVPPIPIALQQMHNLLSPTDGVELRGHDGPVAQLAASRNGQWLASGDHQGLVRLWSIAPKDTANAPKLLHGHWGRITQLMFTANNRWLVSGSTDSAVHLWPLDQSNQGSGPILLKNKQGRFASLAISEDGRWLAIAGAGHISNDVSVRVWDLNAEDVVASHVDLPDYRGQLHSLAVSPRGDWIATGNEDGAVRMWRFSKASRAVTATDLRMQREPVRALRFAPDGRSLISAACSLNGHGNIRAWGLEGTNAMSDLVLADNSRGIEKIAVTADGRWLFTANDDPSLTARNLTRFDQQDATELLVGRKAAVQAMAVSSNSRWLATAGADNVVRLWYIGAKGPSATPITIRTPRGVVTSVAFAREGNWLATGNDRGMVQLWNLQVDDMIRLAKARLTR